MNGNELRKHIGKKINYYRKKKGLTQLDLGNKVGVKNSTISDYERGKISPDQDVLFRLSEFFEVSIDDFFPPKQNSNNELHRALEMADGLNSEQVEFLNSLIEKILTSKGEEREKLLEGIRFTVKYHENQ